MDDAIAVDIGERRDEEAKMNTAVDDVITKKICEMKECQKKMARNASYGQA